MPMMLDSKASMPIKSVLSLAFLSRLEARLRRQSWRLTAASACPKTTSMQPPPTHDKDSCVAAESSCLVVSATGMSRGGGVKGGLSSRVRDVASAGETKGASAAASALCKALVELDHIFASRAGGHRGGVKCSKSWTIFSHQEQDQLKALVSLCDVVTRGALLCCEGTTSAEGGEGEEDRYDRSLETLRVHVERAKEVVALCSKGPAQWAKRNKKKKLEIVRDSIVSFATNHNPELATNEDVYERNRLAFLASRVKIPARAPRIRGWYVPREQVIKDTCDRLGIYSGDSVDADGDDGVDGATAGGLQMGDLREGQRVVGLAGPAGCGKSTAASMVVAREDVRGHFHDGVVWLPVGGKGAKDRLPGLMLRLANMVYETVLKEDGESSLPPPRKPSVGADRQNGAAYIRGALGLGEKRGGRQRRRRRRYLIVAEDVYEPEVLEELKGVGACVLYTTTRSASGMRCGSGDTDNIVRLEDMLEEEAGTVLRRACGLDSKAELPQHARDLMKSYGSLVMDIAYVGRWDVVNGTADAEAWEMALNRIFVEGGEGGDQWTRRRWRTAVLFAGLADLGRLNGKEKDLYLSLAVLPRGLNFTPADAAALLFGEDCSAANLETVVVMLADLERCSVLTLEEGGRYCMHSEHADFVRNRISSFPLSRMRALSRWRKHVSTPAALFAWPVEDLVDIWCAVWYLEEPGVAVNRPYDAVLAGMDQSAAASNENGNENDFSAALERVAQFHVLAEDLEEAHAKYTRLVNIGELKLSTSTSTSRSRFIKQLLLAEHLHGLGVIAAELGKVEEAEAVHARARSIREEFRGANHPDVARSLQALAICASAAGKAEDEQRLLREALSIWEGGGSGGEGGLGGSPNATHDHNFDAALVLQTLGGYALQQGRTAEAEELLRRALVSWEAALGEGNPNAARALNSLGVCAYDRGNIDEAGELYRKALRIRQQRLGPRHLDVVSTMHNLGVCEWKAGRVEEAESLHRQTLAIRVEELGAEHIHVASTLHSLGGCARHAGRAREATGLYRRALEIRESTLGPAHPEVAATLHEMGVSAFGAGRTRQAEGFFWRALAIKDGAGAGPSLDMACTLHNLGGAVFASGGRTAVAEGLFWRALEIREKLGASLDAANTLHCLGDCARERGGGEDDDDDGPAGEGSGDRSESCAQEEAESFYRRALEIQEKELGPNHLLVAHTLFQLGQCLCSCSSAEGTDKSEEALALFARSLVVRETELGRNHEDVLSTLHQLGACAAASGRIDEAEGWYRRAVATEELTVGAGHPTVGRTLHRLGACALRAGKIDEGIATLRRALGIPEEDAGVAEGLEVGEEGGHHLGVALTLQQLAVCAVDAGRTEDAEALFREALAVEEKKLGANHLDVAGTLSSLGECALKAGRAEDATGFYQRALKIEEEKLGADQPILGSTLHCLGRCAEQDGRTKEAEELFRRSLAIEEKQMGADHPHVAATLADLGASALASGRTVEAEGLLTRALAITEKAAEEAPLGCAGTLHRLAECARKSGRCEDAEGLLKRALAIEEEQGYLAGVAWTLGQLASWACDAGRAAEAEGWYRRALVVEEETLGKNHGDVAATLGRLGKCLSQLNKTEEAAGLHRQALEIIEQKAGDRSFEVASILLDIGLCALTLGRMEEAEVLYRRAWTIESEHLGPDHPDAIATARALELFAPCG